jgi:hypothetical protein
LTLGTKSRGLKSRRLKSQRRNPILAHKSGTTSAETSSRASRDATNWQQTRSDSHSTMLVSMLFSITLQQIIADNPLLAGYSSKNDPYAPASGGADGSLLLSDDESSRQINDPMQRFRDFLLPKYQKYASDDVSAADFVQAAGNIGVASCPGGPIIKTVSAARMVLRQSTSLSDRLLTLSKVIGRSDSTKAAPEGTLPFSFGPGSDYNSLIQLWQEKGFNPRELAALMGAHSVSRSFTRQENGIPNGGNLYLTPTHQMRRF